MMRLMLLLPALLTLLSPLPAATPEDSVVRVMATVRYPNPIRPWAAGTAGENVGSGVVLDGKRIITNAHLVLNATDVIIQPRRGGARYEAKVECLAQAVDMAVLSVKDERFFERHPPLERAKELPKVQDAVTVYGFPVGGIDLSVTKGVVSRIGWGPYSMVGTGMIVQVSAAINPGNSGGAAVCEGKMMGLVVSRLRGEQNIGYVIPNQEVDVFLEDVKDNRYDGKPTGPSGVDFQRSENKTLRKFLQLEDDVKGLVAMSARFRAGKHPFQEFDLLTKVGPYDVDNDGMVQLPGDLRIWYAGVLPQLAKDNEVPITIVRKGKQIAAALPVSNADKRVVKGLRGSKPAYFVHGPLVFSPAYVEAIATYFTMRPELEQMHSPLSYRLHDECFFPEEELVVVTSPFLSHPVTKGYQEPLGQVVKDVNGTRIKNLRHLVEVLRDCQDEYLTIRFAEPESETLVFERAALPKLTPEILEDNGISPARQGSEELLKVWRNVK